MKDKGIQLIDNNDEGTLMDVKIIPVRDAFGKIISGFTVGDTLQQNKALLLIFHQGELKFRPDVGVGFEDLLLSSDYLEFRHKIREQFAKDGLKVTKLNLYENQPFLIEASYEN